MNKCLGRKPPVELNWSQREVFLEKAMSEAAKELEEINWCATCDKKAAEKVAGKLRKSAGEAEKK